MSTVLKPMTVEELKAYYDASNAAFAAAPKWKKRVMLATDVQKLLCSERLSALSGSYGYVNRHYFDDTLCDLFDAKRSVVCRTCALSSTLVALLLREDCQITVLKANELIACNSASLGQDVMRKKLQEVFSKEQVDLIEFFYESGARGIEWLKYLADTWEVWADAFIKANPQAEDRLYRIMGNIIKHRGKFVPETLLLKG